MFDGVNFDYYLDDQHMGLTFVPFLHHHYWTVLWELYLAKLRYQL